MSSCWTVASDRDNSMSPDTRRESPLAHIGNINDNSMVSNNSSMVGRDVAETVTDLQQLLY